MPIISKYDAKVVSFAFKIICAINIVFQNVLSIVFVQYLMCNYCVLNGCSVVIDYKFIPILADYLFKKLPSLNILILCLLNITKTPSQIIDHFTYYKRFY